MNGIVKVNLSILLLLKLSLASAGDSTIISDTLQTDSVSTESSTNNPSLGLSDSFQKNVYESDSSLVSKQSISELADSVATDSSVNMSVTAVSTVTSDTDSSGNAILDTIDAFSLFARKFRKVHESVSRGISKSRIQGYGGGVIVQPMFLAFPTKPINKLTRKDKQLRNYYFHDLKSNRYELSLANGAWLYGGVGNGKRIGLGAWSGEYQTRSNRTETDSVMILKVRNSFGGVMLEKAYVRENLNFVFGATIGGGAVKVTKSLQKASFFSSSILDDDDNDNEAQAKARLAGLGIHSGMTITTVPWFHVGFDLNGHFVFSFNGFGGSSNGFASLYPGFRLRLVFGNLG